MNVAVVAWWLFFAHRTRLLRHAIIPEWSEVSAVFTPFHPQSAKMIWCGVGREGEGEAKLKPKCCDLAGILLSSSLGPGGVLAEWGKKHKTRRGRRRERDEERGGGG